MGGGVVVLPTGSSTLQSPYKHLDWLGLNEIVYFLNSGYPPETVLLHAVSQGMTIDRALYAAINSDPALADEFYFAAHRPDAEPARVGLSRFIRYRRVFNHIRRE